MVIKRAIIIFLLLLLSLKATDRGIENLSLDEALGIMQQNNLELKISKFTEQIKEYEAKIARGHKLGKADVIVEDAYSNDAGNVFGFKLKSREATFGDFGAEEFMNNMALAQQGDMAAAGRMYSDPPNRLINPDARNHFQTTFTLVPLLLEESSNEFPKFPDGLLRMSQLDTKKF